MNAMEAELSEHFCRENKEEVSRLRDKLEAMKETNSKVATAVAVLNEGFRNFNQSFEQHMEREDADRQNLLHTLSGVEVKLDENHKQNADLAQAISEIESDTRLAFAETEKRLFKWIMGAMWSALVLAGHEVLQQLGVFS